jgi:ribosomal protein S27AE
MVITKEDWDYAKEQLVSEYKFTRAHAHDAAKRLYRDPQVFMDFVEFKKKGKLPVRSTQKGGAMTEYNVNGHSVSELIYNYELSPVGAFLMLSEISADLEKGESYLRQILEHGHENPVYDEMGKLLRIEMTMVIPKEKQIDEATPLCPECGKPGTWVEDYKRWYCYNCKEYLEN